MSIPPTTPPYSPSRRKLALSSGLILVSIAYALWQHPGDSRATAVAAPASSTGSSITISPGDSYKAANDALLQTLSEITGSSSVPAKTTPAQVSSTQAPKQPKKTAAPAAAPKPAGLYADGSYTGSAADAYYGTVQVKAIVRSGQLADVQFLQYPNTHSNSIYINSQAMPLLTQEAIQAQSANVNGVSGATFTSEAFAQSLAVALVKAKN
ncbi:MAG: FMN-binding protein [Minisyncoccota bacterium]